MQQRLLLISTFKSILYLLLTKELLALTATTQSKYPFQHFAFAPNNVCINPEKFYVKDSVGTTDDNGERTDSEFTMRNVPGDGDCMFLSVALATAASMGLGGNDALLRAISAETRSVVADVLAVEDGNLLVEGRRAVRVRDLLKSAANEEGITPEVYLDRLRNSKILQGGGPELAVLSNVLRRPISIYELDSDMENLDGGKIPRNCPIKLVGSFGDFFRDPCKDIPNAAIISGIQSGAYSWQLHILVVDSEPGQKHACALLPK